jgi:hypothetical protein
MTAIPALRRLRQEDDDFEVSLDLQKKKKSFLLPNCNPVSIN